MHCLPSDLLLSPIVGVKLYQEGYNGNWAVDKLIGTHGQHSIKIPNIAAGQYLLRPEIIGRFLLAYNMDYQGIHGVQLSV